jgi:hypothetical protein
MRYPAICRTLRFKSRKKEKRHVRSLAKRKVAALAGSTWEKDMRTLDRHIKIIRFNVILITIFVLIYILKVCFF